MTRRKQVLYWCVLALLLAGWLYIAWNVPYTHDDWDWGLPEGLERWLSGEGLERWLSGALNNRYAGTFFVLAMTRSQLVKTAVMGGCMFLISLLLGRLAGRGQPDRAFSVTVLTAALLFTTPMDSWQQSLGWVSAFANFVVAAVFLLLVLLLWQRAFSPPWCARAGPCGIKPAAFPPCAPWPGACWGRFSCSTTLSMGSWPPAARRWTESGT